MARTFRGKTEDAEVPFLTADFWDQGKEISGRVERVFSAKLEGRENGSRSYVIDLDDRVELGGEEVEKVSLGSSAGLLMAFQAAGLDTLLPGDSIHLKCTGKKAAKKEGYSARVDFEVEVIR